MMEGTLQINEKNACRAYIYHQTDNSGILIPTREDRKKSLHGDIVVCELMPRRNWHIVEKNLPKPITDYCKEQYSKNKSFYIDVATLLKMDKNSFEAIFKEDLAKNLLSTLDSNQDIDFSQFSQKNWSSVIQRTARVINISQTINDRIATGTCKIFKSCVLNFKPVQYSFPIVIIKHSFGLNYKNKGFAAKIVDWPAQEKLPIGQIIESKDINDSGFDFETWMSTASMGLFGANPEIFPDIINQEAINTIQMIQNYTSADFNLRADYTKEPIITIDPPTAKDLDDAFHIKQLSDGRYELGVHIADVSYYVRPGSILDKIAAQRCNSFYYVHKCIPMLPQVLSEMALSLNGNSEKFCMSIIFHLDIDGSVLSYKVKRTRILVHANLSYEQAQFIIDHENDQSSWSKLNIFPLKGSIFQVGQQVLLAHKVTQLIRKRNLERGRLTIGRISLEFHLDKNSKQPFGYSIKKETQSNYLIQELMILANTTIADYLKSKLPKYAFLRRHFGFPIYKREEIAKNYNIDLTDVNSINKVLDFDESLGNLLANSSLEDSVVDKKVGTLYEFMANLIKSDYFCNGHSNSIDKRHFALNLDNYCHFTSPIRRYSDIIVHRQISLIKALEENLSYEFNNQISWWQPVAQSPNITPRDLFIIAERCNYQKQQARTAQVKSEELFYALLIKNLGKITETCVVINVGTKYFTVVMRNNGFKKTVSLNNPQIQESSYDPEAKKYKITWLSQKSCTCHIQELCLFSVVKCQLCFEDKIGSEGVYEFLFDRIKATLIQPECLH